MKYSLLFVLVALFVAIASSSPIKQTIDVSGGPECALCEFLVSKIEGYLNVNGTTQAQVLAFLDKDCAFLGSLNATCVSLVNTYGPAIINTIINDGTPDALCSDFGLCSSSGSTEEEQQVVQSNEGGALECDLCEFLVQRIDGYLTGNASESQILAFLDKDCGRLGDKINKTCVNIVNAYGPTIINMLVNKANPQQVCDTIGVCTDVEVPKKKKVVVPVAVQGEEGCSICEFIAKEVETLILLNNTQAEIISYLSKECSFIPLFNATCVQIVEQYGESIIQKIINKENPQQVCTEIGFCGGSSGNSSSSSSSNSSGNTSGNTGSGSSGTGSGTGSGSGSGSTGGFARIIIH